MRLSPAEKPADDPWRRPQLWNLPLSSSYISKNGVFSYDSLTKRNLIPLNKTINVLKIHKHLSAPWKAYNGDMTGPDPLAHGPDAQAEVFSGLFER
jgi:hypothetical protein